MSPSLTPLVQSPGFTPAHVSMITAHSQLPTLVTSDKAHQLSSFDLHKCEFGKFKEMLSEQFVTACFKNVLCSNFVHGCRFDIRSCKQYTLLHIHWRACTYLAIYYPHILGFECPPGLKIEMTNIKITWNCTECINCLGSKTINNTHHFFEWYQIQKMTIQVWPHLSQTQV